MTVLSITFRKNKPLKTRIYCALNIISIIYVIGITSSTTFTTLFYVVPASYVDSDILIFVHRILICYVIGMVISHYVTCIVRSFNNKPKVYEMKFNMADAQSLPNANTALHKRLNFSSENAENVDLSSMEHNGYCMTCKETVPPRTHHCFLCETCIIKRDHHCFFMGTCIGKENQQNFVFFCVFMGIATMYGFILILHHFHIHFNVEFYGPHSVLIFFFETLVSLLQSKPLSTYFLGIFIQMYSCLAATIFTFWFLYKQVYNISKGQTPFERKCDISIYSRGNYKQNFKDVFQRDWLMSILVPGFELLKPSETYS